MSAIVTEEITNVPARNLGPLPPRPITVRETHADEAAVDRSMRGPTLMFFGSAILWLLASGVLQLIASIKMHAPGFLSSSAFTTYGRVQPAATNAFLYGWIMPAGIGFGLWLLARLGRTRLVHGGVLTAAWVLWNLGVMLGTAGILGGGNTSFEWLEYPRFVSPVLFTAYAFITLWALLMFTFRERGHVFIAQWYALVAFLWFPWIYATANLFMLFLPVQASAQPLVNAWYVQNLHGLWFTPMALAAAYYLIPKVIGKPVHNYAFAPLGFWTLVFFTGWRGGQNLIDGPVPAWTVSVGIGAAILTIIPLIVIANNLFGTLRGHDDALGWSPTLRFIYVGLVCFLGAGVASILMALRTVNRALHFTQFEVALSQLALYGFVSMTLFGAIYYVVPRLTGWDWASSNLIRGHFWLSLAGLGVIVLALAFAGLLQGYGLTDPKVPISATVQTIVPLLVTRTGGLVALSVANLLFAASFILNLMRGGGRPLVFDHPAAAATRPTATVASEPALTAASSSH